MKTDYPERIVPEQTPNFDYLDHLARYERVKEFVRGKEMLDCGCGNGYGSRSLTHLAKSIKAIDISNDAIQYARAHYYSSNLEFLVMDSQSLEFGDESFDVVCSFDVIEHVQDWKCYLQEIRRTLKRGGVAFLSTPNRKINSPGSDQPLNPFHLREFDLSELRDALSPYFSEVEILGEFEDQTLHTLKKKTIQWRSLWHSIDRFRLRERIPRSLRRTVLNLAVKLSAGRGLESVSERNILFSKENIDYAPVFFVTAKK